jgi:TatD DNase family protein
MLNVGLGDDSNEGAIAAAEAHGGVFATVGCHPTSAEGFDGGAADRIRALAANEKVRAIGETGLDYYRETASPASQREAFEAQIAIGRELGLPIVIHARDPEGESRAIDEIFATLDAQAPGHAVVLHCFSAPERVTDAVERGWHCSFAGNVTYPKSDDLRAAAAQLPDELILVETDAPYLTPQEMRADRNQPANVVSTARVVAEARGVSYEELEQTVEANARSVFGW